MNKDINYKEHSILLIDDEPEVLESITSSLQKYFTVDSTNDPHKVLDMAKEKKYTVILSDQKMPKMQGNELLARIKEISPESIRILITGFTDIEAAIDAVNKGEIFRYIPKRMAREERDVLIKQAIQFYDLHQEKNKLYKANQRLLKRLATEEKISSIGHFEEILYNRFLPLLEGLHDEIFQGQKDAFQLDITSVLGMRFKGILDKIEKFTKSIEGLYKDAAYTTVIIKEDGDLNKIIKDVVDYYKNAEGWEQVKINLDLDENLPKLKMDADRIDLAIDKIFMNSGQAIKDDGTISIKTCIKAEDGKRYIVLEISDNGHGISKEDLGKIFIPFFTTKRKHSGLGLTVVENILNKHNATIEVKSDYTKTTGTTVTVCFPIDK
ncbi:MAG: response regulator [bacterium]